jgi:filamentous hemagglutinin family protein
VTQHGTLYDITGGTRWRNGPNLFHSFDRFSIGTGDTARFSGPAGIENIISRVTGGHLSRIDGELQSTIPGANLYLLNPSGVLFGPNASLDIGGSFHVSTADYLRFTDRATFSAHLGTRSTLTVAPPMAFGFLTENPARIAIRGSNLGVPVGETLSLVGGDIEIVGRGVNADDFAQLSAPSGRINLASVASTGEVIPNILHENPTLHVESFQRLGEITLSRGALITTSDDSGGTVVIRGGRLTVDNAFVFADTEGNVDGANIGIDIGIARDFVVTNGGKITTDSFGAGHAGDIRITADSLQMIGDPDLTLIGSRAFASGTGNSGNVKVIISSLEILNGAEISTPTFGPGQGGNIEVTADRVSISGSSNPSVFTGIFANTFGSGDGGHLIVQAGSLKLTNRASLQAGTFGQGNAGGATVTIASGLEIRDASGIFTSALRGTGNAADLHVTAQNILISGVSNSIDPNNIAFTGLSTSTNNGRGGDLNLTAENLHVTNKGAITANSVGDGDAGSIAMHIRSVFVTEGGTIQAIANGSGRGGDIDVIADHVVLSGVSSEPIVDASGTELSLRSGIFAQTLAGGGDGGDIRITAKSLHVLDGAGIDTRTAGTGNGGDIDVTADSVVISGINARQRELATNPLTPRSSLQTSAESLLLGDAATGRAGDIRIEARAVQLRNGGLINSETTGPGAAGNIEITTDHLKLDDALIIARSRVSPNAGKAGNITITAWDTFESNNSIISTITRPETLQAEGGTITIMANQLHLSNESSISARSLGKGDAGNIRITAMDTFLSENSAVTTEATQADGGNILVTASSLVWLRDSEVTATVGGGPETVGGNITIGSESVIMQNSQIRANAFAGRGGNIQITAEVVLADPASQVSASSMLGIDGQVDIQAPVTDLSGVFSPLPSGFAPATALLRDRCAARLQEGTVSSLVKRGRDGMPAAPGGVLPGVLDGGRQGMAHAGRTGEQLGETAVSHTGPWQVDANGALQIQGWPTRGFSQAAAAWPCSSQ